MNDSAAATAAISQAPARTQGLWSRWDATGIPLAIARLVVGITFIWQGATKALEPLDFHKVLKTYGVLPLEPHEFFNFVVIYVPWLEITLGVAVLCGILVRGAFLSLFGLLVAFTIAVYVRGLDEQVKQAKTFCEVAFNCGCGSGVVNLCWKLLENTSLIAASAVGLLSRSRRYCAGK